MKFTSDRSLPVPVGNARYEFDFKPLGYSNTGREMLKAYQYGWNAAFNLLTDPINNKGNPPYKNNNSDPLIDAAVELGSYDAEHSLWGLEARIRHLVNPQEKESTQVEY